MPRKLLIQKIKNIFHIANHDPRFIRMMDSHFIVRTIVGCILIIFGIIGMITPIPAGFLFVLLGGSLMIGLERTKSLSIRFIHLTRLHILYGKLYVWWDRRKL